MAFHTGFRPSFNGFWMTFHAGDPTRAVGSDLYLLVGNISMAIDAHQFRLLDMKLVGNLHVMGFGLFVLGDLWMTTKTVSIDPFIGVKKPWKPLARFGMAIHTGDPLRMNLRRGPHGETALSGVAGEADGMMGGQQMPCPDDKCHANECEKGAHAIDHPL
jgi:hypothetical protein